MKICWGGFPPQHPHSVSSINKEPIAMSRSRLNLDGTWHFFLDPKQRLRPDTLTDETPRAIRVPGPWQAQFDDLRDYSGLAWYRRTFEARDLGLEARRSGIQASSLQPQVLII